MAPSTGRSRRKNVISVSLFLCMCSVLHFVPYAFGFSLPRGELKLSVPHDAKLGHVILNEILNTSCIELHHIAKLPQYSIGSPVSATGTGSLVVKVPLTGRIGDTVVLVHPSSGRCPSITRPSVSLPVPIYVEVKHTSDVLHFVRDSYLGKLRENSPAGSVVNGIHDLYACSIVECRNNIDYKILGSTNFYLQTQLLRGKVVVEIFSRQSLLQGTHNFILTATDDHGRVGHTNIRVEIYPKYGGNALLPYQDDTLHFRPSNHVRVRRATLEQLNDQNVQETATGNVFSVKQTNNNWRYSLQSSTYDNAFVVTGNGDVSVVTGNLDYEYLTTNNLSTVVTLIINVINNANNEVVKQLEQKVNILDVNDEDPVFLNKPTPFRAAVSRNAAPKSLVYSLTSSDPDSGADLELQFGGTGWAPYFSITLVGNNIANIIWKGEEPFPDNQLFRLSFNATDRNGQTTQIVSTDVEVKAGNLEPQFLQVTAPIRFEESNAEGQRITITPIEVISFQNKAVTFTVLDSQDQVSQLFEARPVDISSQLGNRRGCHLHVMKVVDYEAEPRRWFMKIRATEADTSLSSDMSVWIEVFDTNEFTPRFSVSTYIKNNVPENVNVGTSLLRVTASDQDYNTTLTFRVDDDHFRVVAIDPDSTETTQHADIIVNKSLDYDRISPKLYDFSVFAIDNGNIQLSGDATVRIFITNLNDEKPLFPDVMVTDLRYDTPQGREIYVVQATDADNGDIVSYSLQQVVPNTNMFTLDTATGRITLASIIATDQKDISVFQYKLTVVATDDGGCCGGVTQLSSTGTLTINIATDNLYRPVFQDCADYRPSVEEEKKDALVITVSATDIDHGIYGEVKYSIRGTNSQFRINETSGELFTNATIDREKLVFGSSVTVNVLATDGGNLQGSCSLLVTIKDINDHAPEFISPDTFSVLNSLEVGQVAATVSATDKDVGPNADITYSFVQNPGDYFLFEGEGKTGEIRVAKSLLNQLSGSEIPLIVKAEDAGNPSLHTNSTVKIVFTDDPNNQPPLWPSTDYTVTVAEGTARNFKLLNISATSQHNGRDKALSFTIVEKELRSLFYVQTDSLVDGVQHGALLTNALLDYEIKQAYSITLRAADVTAVMVSDKRVTVRVTDMNDVRPEFENVDEETGWLILSIPEGDYSTSEFEPLGKLVGTVSATDGDGTSPNNQVRDYQITSTQTNFNMVSSSTGGTVYTKGVFDRETTATYSMTVSAIDGDSTSETRNTAQILLKIIISDINDNSPYFPQSYNFTAKEDLLVGSVIARVKAIDRDSDAILQYSIVSDPNRPQLPFSIQQETGDIKVSGPLDYDEGTKIYHFEVAVNDKKFSNSTNVTIVILDVNDNPPSVPNYQFTKYRENDTSIVGLVIQTINATDIDNDGVNTFYYDIKFTDDKYAKYFTIDRVTGELKIAQVLDRDFPNGLANFIFTVEVSDALPENNPQIGYGTISVQPIDINDNRPFFPPEGLQMGISENKEAGAIVGQVAVVDYDSGMNADYDVSVKGQSPDPVFEVVNSQVKTLASLDREKVDQYTMVLEAVDKGSPQLTGTGTLTIKVLDVNDNAPYFNTTVYKFILSEHQKTGEVGTILAYDADIDQNAALVYTLATVDTTYFRMDNENNKGVLKIYQAVDYDIITGEQRSFNLTAFVRDSNPLHTANTSIEIEVTDYNDEIPQFVASEKSEQVREDVAIGTVIAQFNATDKDVNPEYGSFRYFIEQKSDPLNQFAIDQDGKVSIKNSLDRETNDKHTVHILAIDNVNGFPQNTGTATLTVTVTDVNDNFPDFADTYNPSILEGEVLTNRLVVTFSAKDADEDINGKPFFFEMDCTQAGASKQCNKFSLTFNANTPGKETGQLYVTGEFDREQEAVVAIPIKMCDVWGQNRNDQQCGFRYLNVHIDDIDDNGNADGFQSITVYNYKGMYGDFKIGQVNDNDPDVVVTPNSKTYVLLNPAVSGLFVEINPDNGDINLKKKVPEMSFEIQVRVTVRGSAPVTATVRITVVYISEDAVYNSGSVRIKGVTPEDFLFRPKLEGGVMAYNESMYQKFRNLLADNLYGSHTPANLEKVMLLSVMKAGDDATDVRYAAHGSPWYQSSRMDGIVTGKRADFNNALNAGGKQGQIDMVPIDMCQKECEGGGCYNQLVVNDTPVLVNTKGASYVGVSTAVVGTCACRAKDFSGEIQCEPGHCYHGGTCTKDYWGVVSCACPPGFDGPRCQQLRQSFDGQGYAMYPALQQCEESKTSIEILTTKASGIVLYNGPLSELTQTEPTDFILLELVNGYPRMRINQGTGELALEITGSGRRRLDDGVWHTIDIVRKSNKVVQMTVDHCVNSVVTNSGTDRSNCEVAGVTPGENIFMNAGSLLQLGGRMSTPSYPANVITDGFEGCMKNFVHNTEIYDLSTGGQFPGAQDGCPREDNACMPEGCGNGQCLITGMVQNKPESTCICDAGNRTSTSKLCDTDTTTRDLKDQSFVDWRLKNTFKALLNSRTTRVSFHFRTRDQSGVIFSVRDEGNSNKHITFKIINSRLQIVYNLGTDTYMVELSNVQVSDGQWHKVVMERYGKEFILKLDSGEGRYYADTSGPVKGAVDFNPRQDQMYAGGSVVYGASGQPSYNGPAEDDFQNSCLNDIRYDRGWFPMTDEEESQSPAANIETMVNTSLGCVRDDCTNSCKEPFICLPLWGAHDCVCREHYIKDGETCIPRDYCGLDEPCFGGAATCKNNVPPGPNELPYICVCKGQWYGPLCQCHPDLNPSGAACNRENEEEEVVGMANGAIIGIVLGILVLIAAIIILVAWLWRKRKPDAKELLDDEFDDDIRENVMYYDEEGAGEEDQTHYDLSRLRKPDDGLHPDDIPDIPRKPVMPLGSSDRPDIGDFIKGRLNDADDDPGSPPYETPINFNYEGGGSDAGTLSSLNTSSSGDQDYDYLNEWGPKFAKLADMYNNYDSE